ncbi:hypothetical protein B9J07_28130 [Sinorhizobium sp. LM21]|uniref:hypothetical protein n=1 Tax=Sinorhizobium sp. LM21 TaxID=1449788 RepID=UPI0005D8D801|nr:hypothetical protein [Sinorhizobium sp. LM21]AJW30139.1 hypothetical protein pLM21S1_p18 [Sinorhizobium sp. LM21]OWZ90456.1 hypothetical protein B9J07_28130 [Sinorhizobium sp. LM21]
MQLYTVHFTTKQVVSQFNDRGVKTGEYEIDYPQTLHALPLSTCQGYKKFGNWRIEPYYSDATKRPVESRKQNSNFRGTTPAAKKAAPAKPKTSSISNAARTGDLAAAISAGAK